MTTGTDQVRAALSNDTPRIDTPSIEAPSIDTTAQQLPFCLRHNESSQQQLVRLVGYRGPSVDTAASWDRLRRQQAALQAT